MFIALDQAIKNRLEGKPHDRFGNPVDPVSAPGVRIPIFERRNLPTAGGSFDPFRVVANQWKQVPIFNKTTEGRQWEEIFPCVTFDLVHVGAPFDVWLPPVGRNKICKEGLGSTTDVLNQYGEVVASGKPTNVYRPLGDPLDLMYQIEVHSKIEYETYYILRAVNRVFPWRGFISVPHADDSAQVFDMLFQGDIEILEEETPAYEGSTDEAGEYRYRRYALSYIVEGYIDTTWDYYQTTHPAITQAELEMTKVELPEARNVATVEDVLEIIDLTKLM